MRPDDTHLQNSPLHKLYIELMAHATGLPNDELFAQMIGAMGISSAALPAGLGLGNTTFSSLLERHYPGIGLAVNFEAAITDPRALERDDVLALLLDHCANNDISEQWMAEIVTTACMASYHLWQNL